MQGRGPSEGCQTLRDLQKGLGRKQARNFQNHQGRHAGLIHTPATPLGSKLAADHLLATLGFYQ
ncbi:unnamed protein product, partial [Symbiodinium microadriaticum]